VRQFQGLAICPLSAADLEGAQALVAESGWNQVRADWQLFIELGAAFKVMGHDGEVAATAATLPYTGFGWISMVLVGKAHRRQGIATALLAHCMARLREDGLVPVLDATPAGRSVYQPLGFHDGWPITRWRRVERGAAIHDIGGDAATSVRPLREGDWRELAALDARAFGADRTAVLRRLQSRSKGFACVAERTGRVAGYLLGRDGRQATQVGPVVARDPGVASALLAHALARIDGPVLLDVLDRHTAVPPQLTSAGFAVERSYIRMALGCETAFGDADLMTAIAGPELG
jgi:ribosomal protein S18 acetylase RimI-like enzyme